MEEEEDLLRAQLPKSLESNAKRSFTVTLPSLLSSFLLRLPSRVKSSFTSLIFDSPDCPSDHTGRTGAALAAMCDGHNERGPIGGLAFNVLSPLFLLAADKAQGNRYHTSERKTA